MINDYVSLQASISRWLHRSDLVAVVPDLIMLAHVRINRNLRVRQMEKRETLTVVDGVTALPADWLDLVVAPTDGDTRFTFVSDETWPMVGQCGSFYTIMGNELMLSHDGASPDTVSIRYYAKIPSLSDQQAQNWLVEDGPDVYMYGALLESAPYIKDDPRIETWRGLLQVALTDLQASSDRAKYSGGTLVIQ